MHIDSGCCHTRCCSHRPRATSVYIRGRSISSPCLANQRHLASMEVSTPQQAQHKLAKSLQLQLYIPCESATRIATAVPIQESGDLAPCLDNIKLMANLFPGSSMRSLMRLLEANPDVLVSPLSAWYEFLAAYGVSEQTFRGIMKWQAATILTTGTPYQAGTVILTLQHWGLNSSNINMSILLRAPQTLLLQQQQLDAVYRFLVDDCTLPTSRARDFIAAAPRVLLQDVDQQLRPRLMLLQQELGADARQLGAILQRVPSLLMADAQSTVQPILKQLQNFGFQGPELLQLVCGDPSMLNLSTVTLQRKWRYLTQQIGLGKDAVLSQCDTYFSKTITTDIGPRHSFVVQKGLQACIAAASQQQQQSTTTLLPDGQQLPSPEPSVHLGLLLNTSIPEFLELLEAQGDEYEAHVHFWTQTEGPHWTAVRVTEPSTYSQPQE